MLAQRTLDTVKSRFNPQAAVGHNIVFQFKFTDDQPYFIEGKNLGRKRPSFLHQL